MTQVEHYGLHWEGPVAWLLQGRKGTNFVGLKGDCPFRATGMCNHMVPAAAPIPDRSHWAKFSAILSDPLVRAFLPLPAASGKNLFFVEDPSDTLSYFLSTLSRLSSPINPVVRPAWMTKVNSVQDQMFTTNIQPWVLTQATPKTQSIIDRISQTAAYAPRTVIVTGGSDVVAPPPFQRIQTRIADTNLSELITLPLENLGALLIRRYSRNETLDAEVEDRRERRERQIRERNKKS